MASKEQILMMIDKLEKDLSEAKQNQDSVAIIAIGSSISALRWALDIETLIHKHNETKQ